MADGIKNSVETENKWEFCSWIASGQLSLRTSLQRAGGTRTM